MKKLKILFSVVFATILLSGCVYNFIIPEEVSAPIDPENPDAPQISFATEIIPIFNNSNKCTACHDTGGTNPDLTAENAYAALNTKYVNTASPEESKIYTHPHLNTGTHKQKEYTANEAALVLGWIIQGAQNN
jgi:hypothetical protein